MHTPFPFHAMLAFAFLSLLLLAGILIRARIGFFQRFLFPSCLIGGVLGLALLQTRMISLKAPIFEAFAYHLFNVSFISMGLTRDDVDKGPDGGRPLLGGSLWMAVIQGVTFPLQAVIGGLIVILLGLAGWHLFPTFGFLVPLGFNEGPGQALSFGRVWETVGFANGATIGLTFATLGYLFAFFVGVPLVNRGIRKGKATHRPGRLPRDFLVGILDRDAEPESAGRLTIHSANADTLAFQAAMVGAVYGLTYFLVEALASLLPAKTAGLLWGFFFIFGLAVALVVKRLLQAFRVERLIDPGVQRRITGWSVDYLIVATVVAIQVGIVWRYALPIGLMSLAAGVITTLVVMGFGNRLDGYGLERIAAIYGTVTGTVSCGLLLLRMADPDFRTPVAFEVALMNIFAVPIVGGCTVLVNGPLWWHWSVGLTVLVFTGIMALAAGLLWVYFGGRRRLPPRAEGNFAE